MKKILFLLTFSAVMVLASCNRSNNGSYDDFDNSSSGTSGDTTEVDIPDLCQLFYKTVNDEKLQFESIDTLAVFGTAIASNEYENGQGVITFESDIDSVADKVFRERTELLSVELPECVKKVGKFAFYGCTSLTSVVLPDSVESIGNYAFEDCSALESVVIPNSVTSVGEYLFSGCSALADVVLGEGLTVVADGMFNECEALADVVVPEGVTSIGNYAFNGCAALVSIAMPGSLKNVGMAAFMSCQSLKEVRITDLAAWQAIEFGLYGSPLENKEAKLYLNGEEIVE